MVISSAKENSPFLCVRCSGTTRWILPMNLRNTSILSVHLLSFIITLFVIIILGSSNLILFFSSIAIQLLLLAYIRSLYKTELKCDECGLLQQKI